LQSWNDSRINALMTPNPGDKPIASRSLAQKGKEVNLGTGIDLDGKTTYHLHTNDKRGVRVEKVFDQDQKLIKIEKRDGNSRSETHFDAKTGAVRRVLEISQLPDGNSMSKKVEYSSSDRATEMVVVLAPTGELVRKVERQHIGLRTIFQGQTEYDKDGLPTTTVNNYMDLAGGNLLHREHIEWYKENQRALTEHFYFDSSGILVKYVKVMFHPGAGPFLKRTEEYHSPGQTIKRREITRFNLNGTQASQDEATFGEDGEITKRRSTFPAQKDRTNER
jgi:hypothetical protein